MTLHILPADYTGELHMVQVSAGFSVRTDDGTRVALFGRSDLLHQWLVDHGYSPIAVRANAIGESYARKAVSK